MDYQKPYIFHTRWKTLPFTFINDTSELITQKLDKDGSHFLYARTFCRKGLLRRKSLPQSKSLLSFHWTCCVGVHPKRVCTSKVQEAQW